MESVVLISGAPADPRRLFAPLRRGLGPGHDVQTLGWAAAYQADPGSTYRLMDELRHVRAAAGRARRERVHLLGASGGCTAALLFALHHPDRTASLTLVEPVWLGGMSWWEHEPAFAAEYDRVVELPDHQVLAAYTALVTGRHPTAVRRPRHASRAVAELRATWASWRRHRLDPAGLARLPGPLYLPVGQFSPQRSFAAAAFLADLAPDAVVETVAGRRPDDVLRAPEVTGGVRGLIEGAGQPPPTPSGPGPRPPAVPPSPVTRAAEPEYPPLPADAPRPPGADRPSGVPGRHPPYPSRSDHADHLRHPWPYPRRRPRP
ncbi:alpha/beta fold hydrolase [Streptomyces gamaensis]|uniref:Alpha/beta fold hydrolase n=1 Tax=Streptomyces gamaensis TaxID=1763542 RepID=A0ABW0YYY7_9ACTN